MVIRVLLVHSPLVGPLTLEPLGEQLRARGFEVSLPDLRPALDAPAPLWRALVDRVVSLADATDVLVGHSGAGVLLPRLADHFDPQALVFVDAVVPSDGSFHVASRRFVEFVGTLAHQGSRLPPWHEWWGDDAIASLVPDAEQRHRITVEVPCVPRSFYDEHVPLPTGWATRRGCAYLQLSAAYDDDRARAEAYGWPTARMDGQHLDVAVRPADVAIALVALVEDGRPP